MPATFVLLGAMFLTSPADGASTAASLPPLVTYELVESSESMTPRGRRNTALGGAVTVREGSARWDLTHGTFPHSLASSVVVGADGITLLDRKEKASASASNAEFLTLFRGSTADPGAAASRETDVTVSLHADGKGHPFEERPTIRFVLKAIWTVVHSMPGQITRVKVEATGTVETVDLPAAASPLDALDRLVPARGAAREALATELAKVPGLPVFVEIGITSASSVEAPGMPAGNQPPQRPAATRFTVTRRVKSLLVRAGAPGDEALVAVPDDYRARGLERLLLERSVP